MAGSKTAGFAAVLTATGTPRWSIEHAANDLTAKPATVGTGSASYTDPADATDEPACTNGAAPKAVLRG